MVKFLRIFAQVILSVIFIAFAALIFSFFEPKETEEFLEDIIGSIPLCDPWFSLLTENAKIDMSAIGTIFAVSFFEAIIMGICMTITKKISDFFEATKLIPFGRILITTIGIVIGAAFCSPLPDENLMATLATGLIIVYGLTIMLKSILPIHPKLSKIIDLTDILLVVINALVAVILSGFIVTTYLFGKNIVGISLLIKTGILSIISLLILYAVDGIEETKKSFEKLKKGFELC